MTLSQPQARASATEWSLAGLLAANLAWTTLCLGGYRPETMLVSWLLTGAAWVLQLVSATLSSERAHPSSWYAAPFLVYAAANVLWVSPVPWLGWRDWLGWLQMAGVFWMVVNGISHRGPRDFLLGTITALGLAAVILACYQRFLWPEFLMLGRTQASQFFGRSSGPFGIPNSLAAFLLLLIPVFAAFTWQRGATAVQRIGCGYLCAVFLLGLGLTISRGAWISLIGAVVFWPLCMRERSWEWRVGVSIAGFTLSVLAAGAVYLVVPQVKERFDRLVADAGERSRPILWRAAGDLFAEAPLLGTGAGSFNTLFEPKRPLGFRDEPQWAHNDYLNTLSDYGSVGFILSFGAIGAIVYGAAFRTSRGLVQSVYYSRTESPDITRAIAIGLLAFGFSLVVDFHLKIPALAMIVAVIGAECVLRTWSPVEHPQPSNLRAVGAIFGALGVALITLAIAVPLYRGEALRYDARYQIDQLARKPKPTAEEQRNVLTDADNALQEAALLDPANGQTWADCAYVSALWARIDPARAIELGQQADRQARTALEKSKVVPEFWVRLGVALDLEQNWAAGTSAFGQAIQLAPKSATIWYYQAYHLSLTPATRSLSQAALHQALLLDPTFQPAIILQQTLSSAH